jgi:invasion protein IalB
MKLMILRMVASALMLFVATTAALAQTAMPTRLFDKVGLGRVQTEAESAPPVDADVVYSPWTRSCPSWCIIKKGGARGGRPVAAAVLVEPQGNGRTALHIWLPDGARQGAGVRMFVDDDTPRIGAYRHCPAGGCFVDFTVDAAFVARLRTGRYLQIQGVNAAGHWTSYRLPLDDFAAAADERPRTRSR